MGRGGPSIHIYNIYISAFWIFPVLKWYDYTVYLLLNQPSTCSSDQFDFHPHSVSCDVICTCLFLNCLSTDLCSKVPTISLCDWLPKHGLWEWQKHASQGVDQPTCTLSGHRPHMDLLSWACRMNRLTGWLERPLHNGCQYWTTHISWRLWLTDFAKTKSWNMRITPTSADEKLRGRDEPLWMELTRPQSMQNRDNQYIHLTSLNSTVLLSSILSCI